MPNDPFASWAPFAPVRGVAAPQGQAPAPGALSSQAGLARFAEVPLDLLRKIDGTRFRKPGAVVVKGTAGPAALDLATALGLASSGDGPWSYVEAAANVDLLTFDVPNDVLVLVEEVVIAPLSTLAYDECTFALVDGGADQQQATGRVGESVRRDLTPLITLAEPVPVFWQVSGPTVIRLQATNGSPEGPHPIQAEIRGTYYRGHTIREFIKRSQA